MRNKINWILGALIAIISGCKPTQKAIQQEVVALYGVPYATYDISGKVVDQEGDPIEGASIIVKGYNNQVMGDTLISNKKGLFSTTISEFPTSEINIVAHDKNEKFHSDSVQHSTTYKKDEEGRGFYRGKCEIKTTIRLKNK